MGVLAEKEVEFMVGLVAPCNTLASECCRWVFGQARPWMDFTVHTQILNHGMQWPVQTNAVALGLDMHSHSAAPSICPLKSTDWWKSWEVAYRLKNYLPSMPAHGGNTQISGTAAGARTLTQRAWRANPPTACSRRGWSPTHVLLLASSLLMGNNENSFHL